VKESKTLKVSNAMKNECNIMTAPRDRDVLLKKYYGGETAVCYWDQRCKIWRKREDGSKFLGVYKWEDVK